MVAPTMLGMAGVVDLRAWRRDHATRGERTGRVDRAGEPEQEGARFSAYSDRSDRGGLDRLERAVEALTPLVAGAQGADGHVEPRVETELLAVIGELTVGLIAEATGRAERLARQLKGGGQR